MWRDVWNLVLTTRNSFQRSLSLMGGSIVHLQKRSETYARCSTFGFKIRGISQNKLRHTPSTTSTRICWTWGVKRWRQTYVHYTETLKNILDTRARTLMVQTLRALRTAQSVPPSARADVNFFLPQPSSTAPLPTATPHTSYFGVVSISHIIASTRDRWNCCTGKGQRRRRRRFGQYISASRSGDAWKDPTDSRQKARTSEYFDKSWRRKAACASRPPLEENQLPKHHEQ